MFFTRKYTVIGFLEQESRTLTFSLIFGKKCLSKPRLKHMLNDGGMVGVVVLDETIISALFFYYTKS